MRLPQPRPGTASGVDVIIRERNIVLSATQEYTASKKPPGERIIPVLLIVWVTCVHSLVCQEAGKMAIKFRPTAHVITADGEWVAVDELSYLHARPLRCGSCHIHVLVTRDSNGAYELIHRPRSEIGRRLLRRCRYGNPVSASRRFEFREL